MADETKWTADNVVRTLENEIGFRSWHAGDPRSVIHAWTRLLARTVGNHAFPSLYEYADEVGKWAERIETAPEHGFLNLCEGVHDRILEIDNVDGWPADRAGNALNAVCLGAMYGLDESRCFRTRWPAEASQKVWGFVTGCGMNGNEVISISRAAWQRHLYGQALALVRMGG